MKSAESILVVGPSWVGDMMMAQSLFILLKKQQPNCRIDVLAPAWSLPLLAHMPEVSEGLVSPFKHGEAALWKRYKMGKALRNRHYDQAIVLPNSLKSALVPFFARIPRRTGYIGEMRYGLLNDARKLDPQKLSMTVKRFVALGLDSNQPVNGQTPSPSLHTDDNSVDITLDALHLKRPISPLLILCPGAEYGPAKQWPAYHFAALALEYLEQGWQVWLLGSEKDKPICSEINSSTDERCQNLAGNTELGQVIDLMSLATAIVSNDSGLMHIAAAMEIPLVAIYGSSDPGFTPPLSTRVRTLSLSLPCSPCFKRQCPLGHLDCLIKLEPEMASRAISSLLEDNDNG